MILQSKNLIFIINGRKEKSGLVYSSFVKSQFESIKSQFEYSELIVLTGGNNLISFLKNIIKLRKTIPNNSIVHAQYGTVTALVAALSKKKSPLIISFCGDDVIETSRNELKWKLRSYLGRQMSFIAAGFAKELIAKSFNIYNNLPKKLQKKCTIIPNGVDPTFFYVVPKNEALEYLNWNNKNHYILFNPSSGNNCHVKNLQLAEKIVNELKNKISNVELILIENRTSVEINMMMNAADCLLLTSFHEGSPNIVKEALATNLPIVSVNCGDVSERLSGVSNSYVSNSYCETKMSDLILNILNNSKRSNGREKLQSDELFIESVANKIMKIYKKY